MSQVTTLILWNDFEEIDQGTLFDSTDPAYLGIMMLKRRQAAGAWFRSPLYVRDNDRTSRFA